MSHGRATSTSSAVSTRSPLVLASASPRRSDILARLGFEFVVEPAAVDEVAATGIPARWVAEDIAARKLRAVMVRSRPRALVVAADTIVVAADGELLGKPTDAADARRMLRALGGTTHEVITGVAIGIAGAGHEWIASEVTRVSMRSLTSAEVDAYVASGEPFGKAGSYAIQETGDRFVTQLDGSFDNVVGFPGDLFLRLHESARAVIEDRLAERPEVHR